MAEWRTQLQPTTPWLPTAVMVVMKSVVGVLRGDVLQVEHGLEVFLHVKVCECDF